MAAPLDRGPTPDHTHARMLRLIELVTRIDEIEIKLEESDAAINIRFRTIPHDTPPIYKYDCPKCAGQMEVRKLLKVNHHHICPHCCEIVVLKFNLHHVSI